MSKTIRRPPTSSTNGTKKAVKEKNVTLQIVLPAEMARIVRENAAADGCSASAWVRMLLMTIQRQEEETEEKLGVRARLSLKDLFFVMEKDRRERVGAVK